MKTILGVLAAATWLLFPLPCGAGEKRPNFVVILCDDLGYGDLACFGHKHIKTPNLDRLATQGLRLTACYAAAPVCSPSRAGLMTGRNPSRIGIYDWIPANHPMHLPQDEITIATLLKRAGYRTAHVGKWHLNGLFNAKGQPQPADHGFDHWMSTQNNAAPNHENPKNFVRNGKSVGPRQGFSCQLVADEAIDWLKKGRGDPAPFFLFVCFHEPHELVASPPELVKEYSQARNENEAQYFANVTNMDRAVGRLLAALDDFKLADDTLVFFTSDNGPETLNRYKTASRCYGTAFPLRGKKLSLYEGGIRVPGILRWPGPIPPGRTSDVPVGSVDLLPTFCRLAGIKVPADRKIDGANIAAIFDGKGVERKTPLFWHYFRADGPKAALRDGDWVVLAHWDGPALAPGGSLQFGQMEIIKKAKLTTFELYKLRLDVGQEKDVSTEEPLRLEAMSRRLQGLYAEIQAEGRSWDVPQKK